MKNCMESTVDLLVPLEVKVSIGRSWGHLKELNEQ